MLKLVINFFFLILILFKIISCSDYCNYEHEHCYGSKHLSCENNEFSLTEEYENFEFVDMSSELRSTILEEINEYRNRIALGKVKGFPTAANMQMMTWHREFEVLMEIAVEKVDYRKFYCVATDDFILPYEIGYKITGDITSVEFLKRAMKAFMKTELKSPDETRFTSFYIADNFKIGCAYATYNSTLGKTHLLKCLTNKWAERELSDAYEEGDPCSHCGRHDTCCDFYAGLCAIGSIGPPGPPGPQGIPGPNCEQEISEEMTTILTDEFTDSSK